MKVENKKRVAVVGVVSSIGEKGGAERLYEGLKEGIKSQNVDVDLILKISDERDINTIKESYLRFYDLDLSAYDGVISTKAPSYVIRHKNHICYLIHTMRVFYDMFDREFPHPNEKVINDKTFIQNLDTAAFNDPNIKKIFTIGNEVTNRLLEYNGVASTVIHPALQFDHFKQGDFNDYLFIPGRLHRWKRLDLLIKAMSHIKNKSTKLFIAGAGEDEMNLRKAARKNDNVIFMGKIPEQSLITMYSGAFVIPFVPFQEDYGYITIEAFRSGKPVITCSDSGEPAWFVDQSGGGIVCDPDPVSIAKAIDTLSDDKNKAYAMGSKGHDFIKNIQWPRIAEIFLNELFKYS